MEKFKEYSQEQTLLLPPNLSDKIDKEHICRVINKIVERLDISRLENLYSIKGRKAYHPRMLLKVLVYAYSLGLRSSRRIEKATKEDLVFMWLSCMQEPDFRTINRFRKDTLKDVKEIFLQVLEVCRDLKLVRCGKIVIDGTKIEANASRNKATYRKELNRREEIYKKKIDEIFREADEIDELEDKKYGDWNGYSLDREYTTEEIEEAMAKLKTNKKQTKELNTAINKLEEIREKKERIGENRNSYGNTDKDATVMRMKRGETGLGYNVQFATEDQVILGYGVYQRANDLKLLEPMIEEVEQNIGNKLEVVIADKGYGCHENYKYLEKKGLKGAVPYNNYDYDRVAKKKGNYEESKDKEFERLKVKMLDYLNTDEGRELYEKRKYDVEPTIGDIKHNMNFRKFLLRTMDKVKIEVGLVSIAHNIKKIYRALEVNNMELGVLN
ncbi:IS1182 family transposase [bacterium]|nr:IS1182 family transposase [bacterium]